MSHLREHKFKHNFQGCLNPICSCGFDIESTSHFLLHCPTFNNEQYTLLSTLNIDTLFDKEKKHTFLMQQLNIFYLLKDLSSLLFSKFPSESLNPSKVFLNVLLYLLPNLFLSYFFVFVYSQAFYKFGAW